MTEVTSVKWKKLGFVKRQNTKDLYIYIYIFKFLISLAKFWFTS